MEFSKSSTYLPRSVGVKLVLAGKVVLSDKAVGKLGNGLGWGLDCRGNMAAVEKVRLDRGMIL